MDMEEESVEYETEGSQLTPVTDDISPETLMYDFRGQKVMFLVVAAIVVHVVVILGSSFGFVRNKLFGADTSEMSKEDRIKVALGEATSALGDIVKRHDLVVDDLTSRLAGGGSRASKIQDGQSGEPEKLEQPDPKKPEPKKPERKLTEFEKNLHQAKVGPEAPKDDGEDMSGL